jgi:hypothetical protein
MKTRNKQNAITFFLEGIRLIVHPAYLDGVGIVGGGIACVYTISICIVEVVCTVQRPPGPK